jgi:multiple sugar transport system ATP-binding protein
MGVRPEDIHDEPDFVAKNPDAVVTAKVDVVELMGSETNLYLVIEGKEGSVTAVVDARSLSRTGDTIKIGFDLYNVHLFDQDTESSIIK